MHQLERGGHVLHFVVQGWWAWAWQWCWNQVSSPKFRVGEALQLKTHQTMVCHPRGLARWDAITIALSARKSFSIALFATSLAVCCHGVISCHRRTPAPGRHDGRQSRRRSAACVLHLRRCAERFLLFVDRCQEGSHAQDRLEGPRPGILFGRSGGDHFK